MRTELALLGIALLGVLMIFLHLQGAHLVFILSLFLLASWYFPLGFYSFSVNGLEKQPVILSILGGLFTSALIMGILFFVLLWEGAFLNLTVGIIGTASMLLTGILLRNTQKNYPLYYKRFFIRTGFWLILGLVALGVSYTSSWQEYVRRQMENIEELDRSSNPHEPNVVNPMLLWQEDF